jgi:hypothetical protein
MCRSYNDAVINPSATRLRARVRNGRLVLDVPTDLPEDTVLDLVIDDADDDLDEAERQARDAAILKSWAQAKAGQLRPAEEVIDELRRRRST